MSMSGSWKASANKLLGSLRSRPANTIFYVSDRQIVRADIDGEGAISALAMHKQTCLDVAELPRALSAVIGERAGLGDRVWVLFHGFWTQSLSLPSAQVAGVDASALTPALAFEAEPFSGMGDGEAYTAHVCFSIEDGMHHYWVCQTPRDVYDRLEQEIQTAGGRLEGGGAPGRAVSGLRRGY